MKEIIKYVAKDNTEFTDKAKCIAHEDTIDRVDAILQRLPKLPEDDGCKFVNGGGYIKHDRKVLLSVWNDLIDEFKKVIDHKWMDESKDMKADASWVGKLVGDYDIKPYWKAWNRMSCIHRESSREFGQPYYANNPDKAEQFELAKNTA